MLKGDKQSISQYPLLIRLAIPELMIGRGGSRDKVQCPQKNKRKTGLGNTMLLC